MGSSKLYNGGMDMENDSQFYIRRIICVRFKSNVMKMKDFIRNVPFDDKFLSDV